MANRAQLRSGEHQPGAEALLFTYLHPEAADGRSDVEVPEHPLLWLCAGFEESLAKGAQLRSGEHQPRAEALLCAYLHHEAADGKSDVEVPEHPLLWLCAGSEDGLAERAELRSGEHQPGAEALLCAYPHPEAAAGRSDVEVPEHPLLWVCAGSEDGLAERAQLRSGEHRAGAEALLFTYPHHEAADGRSCLEESEHPILWSDSGSREGLAERAELRSGEHQPCAEDLGCPYSLSDTAEEGSQLWRAECTPP